jgi:hypothetical protein
MAYNPGAGMPDPDLATIGARVADKNQKLRAIVASAALKTPELDDATRTSEAAVMASALAQDDPVNDAVGVVEAGDEYVKDALAMYSASAAPAAMQEGMGRRRQYRRGGGSVTDAFAVGFMAIMNKLGPYLRSRYAQPIYRLVSRAAGTTVSAGDAVIVRVPISLIVATGTGALYTVELVTQVINRFNDWATDEKGGLQTDYSTQAAQAAADAIQLNAANLLTGAATGTFILADLGLVPVSAVLAALLFTLKVSFGTSGGRAYLLTGFSAWYASQTPVFQAEFKKGAEEYAQSVKEGAADGIAKAAQTLGPLLGRGAAGKDATPEATALATSSLIVGSAAAKKATTTTKEDDKIKKVSKKSETKPYAAGDPDTVLAAVGRDAGLPSVANVATLPPVRESANAPPVRSAVTEMIRLAKEAEAKVKKSGVAQTAKGAPRAPPPSAQERAAVVERVEAGVRRSPRLAKGGRITRKRRAPRRARRTTRRTKVLGPPVFVY